MDRFKQCLLTLLNRITLFIHKVWYAKWLVLGCILLFIPLSFYIYTFGSNGISGDTEKWAQFGDYIGGTYSVLLSVLVIYIARKLTKKGLYRYCPWMRGMATSQISCNNGIDKKASHVPL